MSAGLIITYEQTVNAIEFRSFDKLAAIRDLKVDRIKGWLMERVGDLNVVAKYGGLSALEDFSREDKLRSYNFNEADRIREYLSNFLENHHVPISKYSF